MHPKSGEGWTRYLEILINNHTLDMTWIIFNVCNELEIEFELYAFKHGIKSVLVKIACFWLDKNIKKYFLSSTT